MTYPKSHTGEWQNQEPNPVLPKAPNYALKQAPSKPGPDCSTTVTDIPRELVKHGNYRLHLETDADAEGLRREPRNPDGTTA